VHFDYLTFSRNGDIIVSESEGTIMYEVLDKEFERIVIELEKAKKQKEEIKQKRKALTDEYHKTKVLNVAERDKLTKETNDFDEKILELSAKRRAVGQMLEVYYNDLRLKRENYKKYLTNLYECGIISM
jgi:uncharacterized coiled-coil DUF342 family protein